MHGSAAGMTAASAAPATANPSSAAAGANGSASGKLSSRQAQSPYPGLDTAASNLNKAIAGLTSASAPAATPSGVKDINAALAQKKAIRDAAHAVLAAVEEPQDLWFEWAGTLGLITCIRLLWDWGVIDAIPLDGEAGVHELAEKTSTQEKLLSECKDANGRWRLDDVGMTDKR
jgi:hypothetical protein